MQNPSGTPWSARRITSELPAARFPERDYDLECHENLNKAKNELHLFNVHGDKRYESRVMANHAIVVRKGRLKP
jgi:hypothetical protein